MRLVLIPVSAQVRLQLQNIAGPGVIHKYKGPLGTIRTIVAEEGVFAPFKVEHVLSPSVHPAAPATAGSLGPQQDLTELYQPRCLALVTSTTGQPCTCAFHGMRGLQRQR